MKNLQQIANSFARTQGWGRATKISFDDKITEPKLGKTVEYGFRKKTTGQYVPKAYLNNFGWKNTYYQHAVCEVVLPASYRRKYA